MDGSPNPPQLVNKGAIAEKKTPQATNEVKSQQQLGDRGKGRDTVITKGKHLNKASSSVEVKEEAKQGLKSKLKSSVNPVHAPDGNITGIVT